VSTPTVTPLTVAEYAQAKARRAGTRCWWPACPEVAVRDVVVGSRPFGFCEPHAELLEGGA
jgi:hypothetical protein